MTRLGTLSLASCAAVLAAAGSASSDYAIIEDSAFPSIVFIEFDPDTLPKVVSVPGGASTLPLIEGGYPSDADLVPAPTQSGSIDVEVDVRDEPAPVLSLDERAQQRVEELVNSDPVELENQIIDREIEDRLLDGIDLR
ncbi:hypothetical protein [Oricola cellulosilytica]|uniref:Uncharacterized protein n=1 Tax=Oricola cellulosilytica TaxID=1429082 RepID=A0A4R0P8N4_9HYPH|nr:hypothetical protein [Oricola cellulosilytica]TCD13432.1 hypothetical protein E0D97_13210 [Oricola cellulosilytica]